MDLVNNVVGNVSANSSIKFMEYVIEVDEDRDKELNLKDKYLFNQPEFERR